LHRPLKFACCWREAEGLKRLIPLLASGSIDTNKITSPVVGFILDPKWLMYNLTLEGSKISRISR
jgi:hypothetical protein